MSYTNPPVTTTSKIRDVAKTIAVFLACAGFVTFGLAVMFLMPAGAWR